MIICNPAYYVTGALIVLVSMLFVNSQNLRMPNIEELGLDADQILTWREENADISGHMANASQKVIMITIVASSTSGLAYVFTSGIFNAITPSQNFGCYNIINAMLSGAVAISAASN